MSRGRRSLWWALGAGLVVRIAWCAYAARTPVGLHDPGLYRFLAERLVDGHGYSYADGPTAYYPPGYPFLLAAVIGVAEAIPGIGGPSTFATVVVNLAASAGAIALAWRLARLGGPRAAAAAGFLVALWPNLVLHTAVPLTETVTLVVVLGLAVLVVEGLEAGFGTARVVAIGATVGVGLLLRPVLLPLVPALLLVWLLTGAGWRAALLRTLAVGGVAVLVVAPWVARNAARADTLALTLNNGDNLCIGHQPGASGGFDFTERCFPPTDGTPRPQSEVDRDARNRRLAWEHLRSHLAGEPALVVRRAWETVRNDHDGLRAVESFDEDRFLPSGVRTALRWVSDLVYLAGVVATIVVLPRALRRGGRGAWVVLGLAVALLLPPLLTFGEPRFKVPAVPLLLVLLAVGVVRGPRPLVTPSEG